VGGLAIDGQGNVYISDFGALEIRKVTPEGTIQRFAGTGALPDYLVPSNAASGVPALKVALNPGALAIDSTWLYVSDISTWSVVAFTLDGKNSKVVAGNHGNQSAGDGGLASNASLFFPGTLALANGMLYINEAGGARVREVNQRTGMIATLVELVQSYASDNGNEGLAADSNGSVYLQHGSTIERIYANTVNPQPYAGGGESVVGDPGEALAVTLMEPRSLAVNPVTFDLSLADSNANFVETIAWGSGFLEPVAGMVHFAGDGGHCGRFAGQCIPGGYRQQCNPADQYQRDYQHHRRHRRDWLHGRRRTGDSGHAQSEARAEVLERHRGGFVGQPVHLRLRKRAHPQGGYDGGDYDGGRWGRDADSVRD
jgi:hypothetical protein